MKFLNIDFYLLKYRKLTSAILIFVVLSSSAAHAVDVTISHTNEYKTTFSAYGWVGSERFYTPQGSLPSLYGEYKSTLYTANYSPVRVIRPFSTNSPTFSWKADILTELYDNNFNGYYGGQTTPLYQQTQSGATNYGSGSFSISINAADGFNVINDIQTESVFPYGRQIDDRIYPYNYDYGLYEFTMNETVTHTYNADPDSLLYQMVDFFEDVEELDVVRAIEGRVRNAVRSNHWLSKKGKKLFIQKKSSALGTRGSISTDGTHIHTASPGILAYDFTFGDADSIALPFAFGENKDGSTLEVFFEGGLLGSVRGDDYELDELSFMNIDMTGLKGQTGLLEFIINTTGTESANVFIPESLATSAVPVPAAVWLFGSGLFGLVAVARRKKAA